MRIGAYQFPLSGHIADNMARILSAADRAVRTGIDLLIYDFEKTEPGFGELGRKSISDLLVK